jgi:hypothetical protein
MAHNYEASGSCTNGDQRLSFNLEEATILLENSILVPSRGKLPHG